MERTSRVSSLVTAGFCASAAVVSGIACAQATEGNVLATKDSGPGGSATDSGAPPSGDGGDFDVGDPDVGPPTLTSDPKTCDEAATYKSYVGCDYWPTVTSNIVWDIFDFAV